MDDTTRWLFGTVFGLIGVLYAMFYKHNLKCADREAKKAMLETKVIAIEKEIGTHETGIIGQLHRFSKAITRLFDKTGLK